MQATEKYSPRHRITVDNLIFLAGKVFSLGKKSQSGENLIGNLRIQQVIILLNGSFPRNQIKPVDIPVTDIYIPFPGMYIRIDIQLPLR